MKKIISSLVLCMVMTSSAYAVTKVTTLAELDALEYGTEFEFEGKAIIYADLPYMTTLLTDAEGTVSYVYGAGGLESGLVITGFTGKIPAEDGMTGGYGGWMTRINRGSIVKTDIIEPLTPIIAEPEARFGYYGSLKLVKFGSVTITEHDMVPENYAYATLDNGSKCTVSKWEFEDGFGRYESITGVYIGNKVVPYLNSFAIHSVGPKLGDNDLEGVEDITVDPRDNTVTYYNLQGKRVDNPTGNQLLIEVYPDGTARKVRK